MTEIPDEEEEASRIKPKAMNGILEGEEEVEVEDSPAEHPKGNWDSRERARQASGNNRTAELFWLNDGRMFLDAGSIDEESDKDGDDETIPEKLREAYNSERRTELTGLGADDLRSKQLPTMATPVRLFKRRKTKAGRSALGTSVLSMRGSVGAVDAPLIDLRLDTCADITLISEEYYNTIPNCTPI
jgi:hypothetical protein